MKLPKICQTYRSTHQAIRKRQMDILHLFTQNLLSPAIMFFALGILAGFLRSDLEVPDSIIRAWVFTTFFGVCVVKAYHQA